MLNTVHYLLTTTSTTNGLLNALVTYDVYYDVKEGISYTTELREPVQGAIQDLMTTWSAKVVNDLGQKRLEYDILQRIYYQTRQTIQVESALYKLQEDLEKFLASDSLKQVQNIEVNGTTYPGYRLYTLTIWYDPENYVPIRRENRDRGNVIVDDFTYYEINSPLPADVFELPVPEEAIANFDLYPIAPTLPRFEIVEDAENPEYGIYVDTLLLEIKRHVIVNQWEYGPYSTIKLPWLVEMPVTIYRRRNDDVFPPLVVAFDVPQMGRSYFFITYDFLGYVVTGYTDNEYDLSGYEALPIQRTVMLEDFIPLYAAPSDEKDFVINNFIHSLQSNDFFITAFDMGGKTFDMIIKNFSFHENEGYYLLNVYGKEYWDSVNIEAMFNYVVSGQLVDAHTTPILIYAINSIKRLGIYRPVMMPVFEEVPEVEEPVEFPPR